MRQYHRWRRAFSNRYRYRSRARYRFPQRNGTSLKDSLYPTDHREPPTDHSSRVAALPNLAGSPERRGFYRFISQNLRALRETPFLLSELGLLSVGFGAIAVGGLFVRRVHPGTKAEKDILLAGLTALAAFLLNSLFDVPGHRLGTMLPVLVVCGICTQAGGAGERWPAIAWLSRLFGIGLLVFGVLLFQEKQVGSRLQIARDGRDGAKIGLAASDSLIRTPLDWSLYVTRGYANLNQQRWPEATADFRSALTLEPKLPMVAFDEGRAWVGVNPDLALFAWKECLRRSVHGERNELYRQILGTSFRDVRLRELTLRLSDDDLQLALTALSSGYADSKTLKYLEEQKADLNPGQITALLRKEAASQ